MDILYYDLVFFLDAVTFRVDITEVWDLMLDLRARIAIPGSSGGESTDW